jgi:hypothetical protein
MARKSSLIILCLVFLMTLASSVCTGRADEINAVQGLTVTEEIEPYAATCWVSDTCGGTAITQVGESTPSLERMYWLNYSPGGGTITFLTFIVKFTDGSVLKKQVQKFEFPGGYTGNTCTPFGVPYWGGDPIIGPAKLKVKSDLGKSSYDFEVVK